MSPANIAEHYARLQQAYNEYDICSGAQISNLDESGFSTQRLTVLAQRGSWKRVGVETPLK